MVNFIKPALMFFNIFVIVVCSSEANKNENNYPFVKIGSKYYIVNASSKMNWFESFDYCRSIGGDLVNIESPKELLALQKYVLEINIPTPFWTDGNDLAREGRYMSHTTGRPLVFTEWTRNNPDNSGNEDCIEISIQQSVKTLLMNDNKCENEFYAICQYRTLNMNCSAKTSLVSSNENCMLRSIAEAFTQAADMCKSCAQHVLQPTA